MSGVSTIKGQPFKTSNPQGQWPMFNMETDGQSYVYDPHEEYEEQPCDEADVEQYQQYEQETYEQDVNFQTPASTDNPP